jgi:F-type H+-transporting ATPase subunit epsilon
MKLLVDTPFGEIIAADVSEVLIPGEAGEMGFLPGHTPLVTLLGIGEMRYVVDGTTKYAAVARGYVEVSGDTIRVVTESCETADKIDVARAANAEKRAEKALVDVPIEIEYDAQRETYTRALKRAKARQEVAKRVKG